MDKIHLSRYIFVHMSRIYVCIYLFMCKYTLSHCYPTTSSNPSLDLHCLCFSSFINNRLHSSNKKRSLWSTSGYCKQRCGWSANGWNITETCLHTVHLSLEDQQPEFDFHSALVTCEDGINFDDTLTWPISNIGCSRCMLSFRWYSMLCRDSPGTDEEISTGKRLCL